MSEEQDTIEYEGNYVLKNDRLYDTATYEKNRKSSKYGVQVTWDKSKKSQDIVEVDGGKETYKQSEEGFHFYGANFCCWRAYPDPHRVIQEIIDYTIRGSVDFCERHLEELKEGKADPHGCFSIQLYMVPGANSSTYSLEHDRPIVDGSIFIGSFHVSGIKGER